MAEAYALRAVHAVALTLLDTYRLARDTSQGETRAESRVNEDPLSSLNPASWVLFIRKPDTSELFLNFRAENSPWGFKRLTGIFSCQEIGMLVS
jgi:hypothetical protein